MKQCSDTMNRSSLTDDDDIEKMKELKEFDETKAGVKGLIDSGLSMVPRIFHCPPDDDDDDDDGDIDDEEKLVGEDGGLQVPVVDLQGLDNTTTATAAGGRNKIVGEIRMALETWGCFQMINHGVPIPTMDNLLECVKQFHEQSQESKLEYYSRDSRKVKYYSTADMYITKVAQWKDSLSCDFEDDAAVDSQTLPSVCRGTIQSYLKCMVRLRNELSELLSEALGLEKDRLASMECLNISKFLCHYYPPCPQPELTQGTGKHSDPFFLTILLQDSIGGLQVYHKNKWVDVPPLHGSLIVNAGDILQLISNDKFISVDHRVKVGQIGPRISAVCFLFPSKKNESKAYGPLTELLSKNNAPKYRETSYKEYVQCYAAKGVYDIKALPHFKIA